MTINKLIKQQQKIKENIFNFKNKDYSSLVGSKVRITKKYSKWLKSHIDEIFTRPGSSEPEATKDYLFEKEMIKKRFVGKVVKLQKDELFEFTATVEFVHKNKTYPILLDITDLQEVE
jgi:hypothetical protein